MLIRKITVLRLNSFRNFAKQRTGFSPIFSTMCAKYKYSDEVINISQFAKAMSHPVRVHIMKKLSGMNTCCYSGDIARELKIGRSTLSQHLKELKHAGLIQGETETPYIKYCINRKNWEKAGKFCTAFFTSLPEKEKENPEKVSI